MAALLNVFILLLVWISARKQLTLQSADNLMLYVGSSSFFHYDLPEIAEVASVCY